MTRTSLLLSVALTVMVLLPGAASATFPGKPGKIVFSADGPGSTSVLYMVDPEGGRPRQITRPSASCRRVRGWSDTAPEFSPNGRLIAFWHSDFCQVDEPVRDLLLARSDGSAVRKLAVPDGVRGAFSFAPDGRRIVFLDAESGGPTPQVVVDITSGSVISTHVWGGGSFWEYASIDWGLGGRVAIGGTKRGPIWTASPRGGQRERLGSPNRDGLEGQDTGPTFSHSGRSIAFVRSLSELQESVGYELWRTFARTPRRAKRLVTSREPLYSPVFSPDGRRIAFLTYDGVIRAVSSSGGRARTVVSIDYGLPGIDWQPLPARRH